MQILKQEKVLMLYHNLSFDVEVWPLVLFWDTNSVSQTRQPQFGCILWIAAMVIKGLSCTQIAEWGNKK